mmetsp:Transcript_10202/g.41544  ORF Transcript_10202/g.41544 Transcript_10202/m.41544 type:complete len:539 (-) Transcript_10202:2819-4435(-)
MAESEAAAALVDEGAEDGHLIEGLLELAALALGGLGVPEDESRAAEAEELEDLLGDLRRTAANVEESEFGECGVGDGEDESVVHFVLPQDEILHRREVREDRNEALRRDLAAALQRQPPQARVPPHELDDRAVRDRRVEEVQVKQLLAGLRYPPNRLVRHSVAVAKVQLRDVRAALSEGDDGGRGDLVAAVEAQHVDDGAALGELLDDVIGVVGDARVACDAEVLEAGAGGDDLEDGVLADLVAVVHDERLEGDCGSALGNPRDGLVRHVLALRKVQQLERAAGLLEDGNERGVVEVLAAGEVDGSEAVDGAETEDGRRRRGGPHVNRVELAEARLDRRGSRQRECRKALEIEADDGARLAAQHCLEELVRHLAAAAEVEAVGLVEEVEEVCHRHVRGEGSAAAEVHIAVGARARVLLLVDGLDLPPHEPHSSSSSPCRSSLVRERLDGGHLAPVLEMSAHEHLQRARVLGNARQHKEGRLVLHDALGRHVGRVRVDVRQVLRLAEPPDSASVRPTLGSVDLREVEAELLGAKVGLQR